AATKAPLVDGALAAADRALGFDWLQWFTWVHSRPVLTIALHAAYDAAGPAIIVLPLYFALSGQPERNSEFLWLLIVSVVLIIPLSGLMPGAGAFVFYGVADQAYAPFVPEFAAIRRGEIHDLALTHLQGIVTFPSFHTTLALLFPYVLRKSRVLCAIASLVCAAMLVAIPSEGGHYLVDVIAGALVAVAAIWATARIEAALASRQAKAAAVSAGAGINRI
ncbi:MAG TPA: phosphatase PAP2 family protein, partial [Stellaceae bacterium]|nr:phosphatase PAP2 family protein [Stellaceae bacterium]